MAEFISVGWLNGRDATNIMLCPQCFSLVPRTSRDPHIEWHRGLLEGWEDDTEQKD